MLRNYHMTARNSFLLVENRHVTHHKVKTKFSELNVSSEETFVRLLQLGKQYLKI